MNGFALKVSIFVSFLFASFPILAQEINMQFVTIDKNLVLIQGGDFFMGSPDSEAWREKDEVLHQVRIVSFYMNRYEVTQREYRMIMGTNPSHFKGDELPVENVSWYDAANFCNALSKKENLTQVYTINGQNVYWDRDANGYRLPTEAEWEYACRAGLSSPFNTGENVSVNHANYFGTYPYTIEDHYFSQQELDTAPGIYRQKTLPVDSFNPNSWELYNMHGNVSEWCYDLYGDYVTEASNNPVGPHMGLLRVCRGGGWNDFGKHLRSSFRSATPPTDCLFNRGFRVVRSEG